MKADRRANAPWSHARALGNFLAYKHRALTRLKSFSHTVLQNELNIHLRNVTKVLPDGTIVDMLARRGNSGAQIRARFTLFERTEALDSFYRTFAEGRYHPGFQMELNAARKAGKLF